MTPRGTARRRRWTGPRSRPAAALDVGLQAERTAMAWQRTALGVGGVSALLLHHAGGRVVAAVPGVAGLLVALALLALTEHRYARTVRTVAAGESPANRGLMLLVSVTGVALAASALVLVSVEVART